MLPPETIEDLVRQTCAEGVQQLVVGAVIPARNTVLLLKRPQEDFMGGIWELPSGKVEPGETINEALIREVHEETGLSVTGISAYLGSFDYRSGSGKHSRQLNFAIEARTTEPVRLTEHDDYTWAQLADRPPTTEAVQEVLRQYQRLVTESAG